MADSEKEERRYYNSAIGTWAGFIYQGWCAVYAVLHLIYEALVEKKEIDSLLGHRVYLDSYDDFSIHDDSNIAISLHQCKIYKKGASFETAFAQMKENRKRLVEDGLSQPEAKLWFHCNEEQEIDAKYEISAYVDHQGDSFRSSKDVLERIDDLIDIITTLNNNKSLPLQARASIFQMLDEKVTAIQKKYHDSKDIQLREIAREEDAAIRFEEIWRLLTEDAMERGPQEHVDRLIAYHFLEKLAMKIEERESEDLWGDLLPEMVNAMGNHFTSMQKNKISEILCRIYPDTNTETGTNRLIEMANKLRIRGLIKLAGQAKEEMRKEIDWHINEKFISPAVFSDTDIPIRMYELRKNRSNLDMLREYDWLLASDVTKSILNIGEHKDFTIGINDTDSKHNIFSEKKIGLLSIEDFNNRKV